MSHMRIRSWRFASLVPVGATFLFGERLSPIQLFGIGLIIIGVMYARSADDRSTGAVADGGNCRLLSSADKMSDATAI